MLEGCGVRVGAPAFERCDWKLLSKTAFDPRANAIGLDAQEGRFRPSCTHFMFAQLAG
jgi:hypothetical protein